MFFWRSSFYVKKICYFARFHASHFLIEFCMDIGIIVDERIKACDSCVCKPQASDIKSSAVYETAAQQDPCLVVVISTIRAVSHAYRRCRWRTNMAAVAG